MHPAPASATDSAGDDWGRLMACAQAGDRLAYRQLLESITPGLRALARRHFRATEDVEDVVQDVLLTLHMIRHTYDPTRPFRPWLVAIARRRVVDRIRRRSRVAAHEVELEPDHETFLQSAANMPEEALHARDLNRAIAGLTPGQRQAFELLKLRQLSLKEAAAESGQSIGALKVAGHRAYKVLRAVLKGE